MFGMLQLQLCSTHNSSENMKQTDTASDILIGAVHGILNNFDITPGHQDLVFSSEFNTQERDVIHIEVMKRGLRLSYCGSGAKPKQHMIVSRRRTALELVEHIRASGGETLQYILHEPNGIFCSSIECLVLFNISMFMIFCHLTLDNRGGILPRPPHPAYIIS